MTVEIFTDGSCIGNPGAGGWAAVLKCGSREKELCGGEAHTTNNRMELTAVVNALNALNRPCDVILTTDSQYVVNGMTQGWAKKWQENGWVKSDRKRAVNSDLWEELLTLDSVHHITFQWIKGHAGHPYNERCDTLAVRQAEQYK